MSFWRTGWAAPQSGVRAGSKRLAEIRLHQVTQIVIMFRSSALHHSSPCASRLLCISCSCSVIACLTKV